MKNLKLILSLFFVAVLSAYTANAQWGSKSIKGNENVIEETRTLSAYTEIEISGNFDIELVQGVAGKISIIAESNLLEHIITIVNKEHLSIEVARKINLNPSRKIKILIPFTELEELETSGSGSLVSKKKIESDKLSIDVSGSANLNLLVAVYRSLKISKSGSGNISIEGQAEYLKLDSSGSGKFSGEKLSVNDVAINLSGSGEIRIACKDEIKAKVTGSGNIFYKGNPTKVDTKIKGSGKIEKL